MRNNNYFFKTLRGILLPKFHKYRKSNSIQTPNNYKVSTLQLSGIVPGSRGHWAAQEESLDKKEEKSVQGQFYLERLIILDFLVRQMTIQKFSSGHAPSKSPFEQRPPHPPDFTTGE